MRIQNALLLFRKVFRGQPSGAERVLVFSRIDRNGNEVVRHLDTTYLLEPMKKNRRFIMGYRKHGFRLCKG